MSNPSTNNEMSSAENKVSTQELKKGSSKETSKNSKEIYAKESIRDVKELLEELFDTKFTLKTSEKLIRNVREYEADEPSEFTRLELASLIPQSVVNKFVKIIDKAVEEDETSESEDESNSDDSGSDSE